MKGFGEVPGGYIPPSCSPYSGPPPGPRLFMSLVVLGPALAVLIRPCAGGDIPRVFYLPFIGELFT